MSIPRLFQLNGCFFFWLRKDPNQQYVFMLLCITKKKIVWKYPPPRIQSSHHQDYFTFSRGIPELNLHLWRLHPGWEVDRKDSWQLFFSAGPLNSGRHESTKVAIIAASSCTRRIGYGYLMCQNSGQFIATYSAGWSPLIWWFSKGWKGILYPRWPKHSG